MGFWGSLAKFALPVAASFIPGVGPVAGPAAAALVSGIGKKKQPAGQSSAPGYRPSQTLSMYDEDFQRRLESEGARGDRFTDAYEQGITSFDPQSYMNAATAAASSRIAEEQGGIDQRSNAARNASGIYGSTIGTGRRTRDLNERIVRTSGDLAYQAAGLQANKLSAMGAYGERARGTALEGSFDRYATRRATEEEERNRRAAEASGKRQLWGGIGSAALGAAGSVLAARYAR